MKIIIDADASPVRKIVVRLAKAYNIDLIMVSNVNHDINEDYGKVITVDQGFDSADHKIVGLTEKDDLVVTQDYGLASLVLNKQAYALHQDGWFFDKDNIDQLLMSRYLNQKLRKANKRLKPIPKRTNAQNKAFEKSLETFINNNV
ncbi:YaiI/YqxD family protein [Liberiplasma polymorphum]|uniref:YaiI/YqxD family protein n=1 Tax=Liberiplasma polymorphum TaxID=3374570 RepID=UPI003772790A